MSAIEIKFLTFRVYRFADTKAFKQLHALHAARVGRYIAYRVNRSEDVEELTSEVFLRSWEYMTAQQVDNITALFFRIARNLIADYYRKSGRTVPLTPAIESTLQAPGSLTDDAQVKEEAGELVRVMKSLKDDHREVLEMRYQDEMTTEEIAEVLGKTPNAVRVLLHRAKQALKAKV
ncbi:MAG: sigma-70 family RNA polymerase sigma factor [Patescibacteria group bacterium]